MFSWCHELEEEKSFRLSDVACTTEGYLLPPRVKLCISDYVDGEGVPTEMPNLDLQFLQVDKDSIIIVIVQSLS